MEVTKHDYPIGMLGVRVKMEYLALLHIGTHLQEGFFIHVSGKVRHAYAFLMHVGLLYQNIEAFAGRAVLQAHVSTSGT